MKSEYNYSKGQTTVQLHYLRHPVAAFEAITLDAFNIIQYLLGSNWIILDHLAHDISRTQQLLHWTRFVMSKPLDPGGISGVNAMVLGLSSGASDPWLLYSASCR